MFKIPKNDPKYYWTNHVVRKMTFYGLSPDRVKRVIRSPSRTEEGVAEATIAVMQSAGTKAKPYEIWVMYQKKGIKRVMISAWRYPGVSPIGNQIPIPHDILEELRESGIIK